MNTRKQGFGIWTAPAFHPIALAVYPILLLYTSNLDKVPAAHVVRPLAVAVLGTLAFLAVLRAIGGNWGKAALLTSFTVIAFSLGWSMVAQRLLHALAYELHIGLRYLFALYVALVASVILCGLLIRFRGEKLNTFASVIALLLIVMNTGVLIKNVVFSTQTVDYHLEVPVEIPENFAREGEAPLPDVYFIVLDAYGRQDVLQRVFQFDNQPFIDAMATRGFHTIPESTSSYSWTNLSLPACLSMEFLERIYPDKATFNEINTRAFYQNNVVLRSFQRLGYAVAATHTNDPLTSPGTEFDYILEYDHEGFYLSRFELKLLESTPIPRILRAFGIQVGHAEWRKNILFNLENMHVTAAHFEDKPVFTQAHIISPHEPFVLQADGSPLEANLAFSLVARPELDPPFEEMARLYRDQVQGLNYHIEKMVDRILEHSETPPVIAIVSDHGPPLQSYYGQGRRDTLMMLALPGLAPGSGPTRMNLVQLFPYIFREVYGLDVPMPEVPDELFLP